MATLATTTTSNPQAATTASTPGTSTRVDGLFELALLLDDCRGDPGCQTVWVPKCSEDPFVCTQEDHVGDKDAHDDHESCAWPGRLLRR